jgi:uncharacterized surface protein with fasciclin (FAS1) repeats
MRKLVLFFLTTLFLVSLFPTAAQEASKGTLLRVANFWAAHDEGAVNVYIDDALALETFASGETSAYLPLTAGTHNVRVTSIADETNLLVTLDIAVGEGQNYTFALTGQSRAFVIDETTAFRSAALQTSSPVMILNATDAPLDLFFGSVSASLQQDAFVVADMPVIATVFSAFDNGQAVVQDQLSGVPNNYTLLAIVSADGTYGLARANYSSLNATDFLRGLGIGDANGLNLALAAFDNASLLDDFSATAPLTIFAPINSAFDAMPEETLDAWLESRILLELVMGYNVVPGDTSLFDLATELNTNSDTVNLTTIQGDLLSVTLADDSSTLLIGSVARVVGSPYRVSNGIIYPIDTLLQPAVLPEVTVLP